LPNDTLHVAHCYPYTTAKLRDYLSNLVKNTPKKGISVVRSVIGKSVGNNPIELLTITEPIDRKQDNRKIIVVMARQHPGETQGSYVCEGMMDFLTGKTKQAEFLRKNFILKVIPMVNPDGVIFGNYRSNLMGYDLNRKWDVYDKDQCFPEVTCIKQLIT
jgi:murein tripeptide amidase MpaA